MLIGGEGGKGLCHRSVLAAVKRVQYTQNTVLPHFKSGTKMLDTEMGEHTIQCTPTFGTVNLFYHDRLYSILCKLDLHHTIPVFINTIIATPN